MTIDELEDIVQAALVAAAAIGSALTLARGRGFAPCLRVLLAVGFAAVVTALVFAAGRAGGVTADDRFTLVHLALAGVVLVPAALLVAAAAALDRAARRRNRALR